MLHAQQGVEHFFARERLGARVVESTLDGLARLCRMKNHPGEHAATLLRRRDPPLAGHRVDVSPWRACELVGGIHHELTSLPEIAGDVDVSDSLQDEHPALGPEQCACDRSLVGVVKIAGQLGAQRRADQRLLPRSRVALPRCGVVGLESSRTIQEGVAQPRGPTIVRRPGRSLAQLIVDGAQGGRHDGSLWIAGSPSRKSTDRLLSIVAAARRPCSGGVGCRAGVECAGMGKNQLFFPRHRLDEWIRNEDVEIDGAELVVRASGLRFVMTEAIGVLSEVSEGRDVARLTGCALSVSDVRARGGQLLETSLVLGEAAYEVVHGFLLAPVGATGAGRPARELFAAFSFPPRTPQATDSDAELLARYLMEKLD